MYGAIIGDIAGSIYEYDQVRETKELNIDKLITKDSFYSDDTILTIAILDCILNHGNYEKYLKKYLNKYKDYKPNFEPFFNTAISPNIIRWSQSNIKGLSKGNGAMMRISPVGYLFNNEDDVINNAYYATIPTHKTDEAINSATKIALIIYYLRKGLSKEEVFDKLNIVIDYKPFKKFNCTCSETIDNCLYAFYNSNSFEESIRNTINMGGDTDTNAAIVGSMAEAIYKIDDNLKEEALNKLPNEFKDVLNTYETKLVKKK
ncbi:MAG: ADP-ribosylglycohydrolase family protein [Bacilli bacterium]|nr:ADP-ribosylglycohydrolase family protein [Bacilli bacterium]